MHPDAITREIQSRLRDLYGEDRTRYLDHVRVTIEERLETQQYSARFEIRFYGHPEPQFFILNLGYTYQYRSYERPPSPRDLVLIVHRVWSQIVEDDAIERQTRRYRDELEEAQRMGAPPHILAELQQRYHEARRHAEVYHTPAPRDMTATEVLARQREYGRSPARQAQELSRELLMQARATLDQVGVPDYSWARANIFHGQRLLRPSMPIGLGVDYGFADSEVEARGMKLLKENLSPEQLKCYEKNRYFDVIGSKTRTTYRIKHGRQMNIEALSMFGNRKFGLCFLPVGNLCTGDTMLAQKMTLELDEEEALRVGNRF